MHKIKARDVTLVILFVLILVILVLLVGKATYSFLAPSLGDDTSTSGEVTASGDTLVFSKGTNISLTATSDNFNSTSGNLTSTSNPSVKLVASSKTNNAKATYYAGIKINTNTYTYTTSNNTAELILTVKDESGNVVTSTTSGLSYVTVNGVSGFDITGKTGAYNIVSSHEINTTSSTTGTTHKWTFTLTFVNLTTDQALNENSSLDMDVLLQSTAIS